MTEETPHWATVGEESFDTLEEEHGGSDFVFDPRKIFRFFMSKKHEGTPRKVMFLDNQPFNVVMHQWEANGHWGNWAACPRINGEISDWCPLCKMHDDGKKVSIRPTGHYSVVDLTGYTPEKGQNEGKHIMPLKILPATNELVSILKLKRSKVDGGDLTGAIFEVVRTPKSKAPLGNVWEYDKSVSLKKFAKKFVDDLKPSLDYFPKEWGYWEGDEDDATKRENYKLHGLPFVKILKPMEAEELAEFLDGNDKNDGTNFDPEELEDLDDDDDLAIEY